MTVDGHGRAADLGADAPHGNTFIPLAGKQLSCRVADLAAKRRRPTRRLGQPACRSRAFMDGGHGFNCPARMFTLYTLDVKYNFTDARINVTVRSRRAQVRLT